MGHKSVMLIFDINLSFIFLVLLFHFTTEKQETRWRDRVLLWSLAKSYTLWRILLMEVGAGKEGWAWCTLSSSCSHHANGNIFTGGFKKVPDIRFCNTQSPWVLQVGKKQGLELESREQAAPRSVCLTPCLSQPLCAAVVPAASLWICCQPSGWEFRPRLTLIFGKLRSLT